MRELLRTDFDLVEYLPIISEVIESGGEFRLFPRGTSMRPLIRQGIDSVILVKSGEKCHKRDVILYSREGGQLVLHRIVRVERDGSYTLCGDNQTTLEKGITQDNVLAVVSAFYRGDKRREKGSFGLEIYERLWCIMAVRKGFFLAKCIISKIKKTLGAK